LFSESETLGAWTNDSFGLVLSWGHGNDDAPVGTEAWGSLYPELLLAERFLSTGCVGELADTCPALVFLCGCLQAYPETTNNLSYALLCNGAVGVVGATRVTFLMNTTSGSESLWFFHGTNPRIMYDYSEKLVRELMSSGNGLYGLKHEFPLPSEGDYTDWWWMNYLGYNLYGCPSVGLFAAFSGAVWSF